jgi:hypothetical protein
MITISSLFEVFEKNQANLIKRVPHVEHIISIYYGYSKKGSYRLALKSTIEPFFSKSTKVIEYSIVENKSNEFWSYFDLNDERFIPIFFGLWCTAVVLKRGAAEPLVAVKKL